MTSGQAYARQAYARQAHARQAYARQAYARAWRRALWGGAWAAGAVLAGLGMPGPAAAQLPPQPVLDQASTMITGTGPAETARGTQEAARRLVVRQTAAPLAGQDPRLGPFLTQAAGMVSGVHYRDMKEGIQISDEQGTRDRQHRLTVTFDLARVVPALRDLGLILRLRPRPPLALHLTVTAGGPPFVVSADPTDPGVAQRAVTEALAEEAGLALSLMHDLPAADGVAVLEGRATAGPDGRWHVAWRLAPGGAATPRSWEDQADSFDLALRRALSQAMPAVFAAAAP